MDLIASSWIIQEIIRPLLDILLLSFILYQAYSILEETRSIQLIKGAIWVGAVYLIAYILKLSTLLWILNTLAPGIVIGLAIVFQPELRKIFTRIGQREIFKLKSPSRPYHVDSLVSALEVLAGRRRGALIVLSRNVGLKNIMDTGTKLNAELTSSLIITIFGHDTPLHDGAVLIANGRIASAGCFLPLSKQPDIKRSFGTRHRAALGLAEETDALVLIASEENGAMSLAYDSSILYDLSADEIKNQLNRLLGLQKESHELIQRGEESV